MTEKKQRNTTQLDQRHQELIADIQARLERISALIEYESQRDDYDWADVGDLGYIQEQLQNITDFHNDL